MASAQQIAEAFESAAENPLNERVLGLSIADAEKVSMLPRDRLRMIAAGSRDGLLHATLAKVPEEGGRPESDFAGGLATSALLFAAYYQAAMEALVEEKDEDLSHCFCHPQRLTALHDQLKDLESHAVEQDWSNYLTVQAVLTPMALSIFEGWLMIALIRHLDSESNSAFLASIRADLVERASVLYEATSLVAENSSPLRLFSKVIGPGFQQAAADAMRQERRAPDPAVVSYNALRLGDLYLLANRSTGMSQTYGMSIERAFERQLTLLFTSLGFAVIESRPGKRHVDLVCIGGEQGPQTMVVEAKSTSSKRYDFRAADQRALIAHVEEVHKTLRDLPAVQLVLIVAPAFSAGATTRIEEAGRRLGLPCHGLPVAQLVKLREDHLGYISTEDMVEQIRSGPTIVDEGVIQSIHRIAQAPLEGWQQFVGTLRAARESRPNPAA